MTGAEQRAIAISRDFPIGWRPPEKSAERPRRSNGGATRPVSENSFDEREMHRSDLRRSIFFATVHVATGNRDRRGRKIETGSDFRRRHLDIGRFVPSRRDGIHVGFNRS